LFQPYLERWNQLPYFLNQEPRCLFQTCPLTQRMGRKGNLVMEIWYARNMYYSSHAILNFFVKNHNVFEFSYFLTIQSDQNSILLPNAGPLWKPHMRRGLPAKISLLLLINEPQINTDEWTNSRKTQALTFNLTFCATLLNHMEINLFLWQNQQWKLW